ncbi:MAG: U32 family peptidase [Clostridiales bacterium]|nr:U32 family peptidase [Clostridiales bacterium]
MVLVGIQWPEQEWERKRKDTMLPELLAPAGGMTQLKAALRFGADAVYGALHAFGLRAFAGNFSWDELEKALSLVHEKGKKFYLTLNIMPYDDEMDALAQAAQKAWEMGVDGAIVSDIGAFLMLRKRVPGLKIHISTQANTLNSESAAFYAQMGAERVVLARELSLERIRALRAKIPENMEIEAFVHGAMCMSYSGRCMLSDHLTGRGGNRGACAQPCRWEYALVEKKRPGEYWPIEEDGRGTYLLSAYDLNMLAHLPQLREAGIASLKIEGRMKTEYYVATVVGAYRRALDALAKNESTYRALLPELEKELEKASHRPYNTGFYYGAPTPAAGAAGFSQSMEYVARVEGWQDGMAQLHLKNRFYVGDTLELLCPKGTFPFEVTDIFLAETNERVETVSVAGQRVKIPLPYAAEEGDFLRGPNRNHQ